MKKSSTVQVFSKEIFKEQKLKDAALVERAESEKLPTVSPKPCELTSEHDQINAHS